MSTFAPPVERGSAYAIRSAWLRDGQPRIHTLEASMIWLSANCDFFKVETIS